MNSPNGIIPWDTDEDEDTQLLMRIHGWSYNFAADAHSDQVFPGHVRGESSNRNPPKQEVLPPAPVATRPAETEPYKKRKISQYFGPSKSEMTPIEEPPPIPDQYEVVKEIPGIPRRIAFWDHVIYPYEGEIISRKTKRSMGFEQSGGYLQIQLLGRKIQLHRYMYSICYNRTLNDSDVIDHLDHNKKNNRITNLRLTTGSGNNENRPQPRRNRNPGLPRGVNKTASGRYTATITVKRKCHYLGTFDTPEAASEAYKQAARNANTKGARFYLGDQI
jgi:hypothetical protein